MSESRTKQITNVKRNKSMNLTHKQQLWFNISTGAIVILLSVALIMYTDSLAVALLMGVIGGFYSMCVIDFADQLHNLRKEEKFQRIMGYINCPNRVASQTQAKFKKGDWIISNEDFEYNLGYCLHIEEVVTDGSDNYYNIRTYYKEPLIPMYEETLSQYHAPWIDKNYRLTTPEEIQYHKEHYSQRQS